MEHPITETALDLVRARLGISSTVRDVYLTAIVKGVIKELESANGIKVEPESDYHLMFVVDLATWRYQNRDSPAGMPRHLQFRLHNLMISGDSNADV